MARTKGSSAEITRPRIRAAALRLFAKHGFAAVSMRQIAAEVGVQVGALYLYTPDKEALLFDLLKAHMETILADWDRRAQEATDPAPVAQLEAFVRFHLATNLHHPETVFLSYMELRNLGPATFTQIEDLRRAYENRLAQILLAGQQQGQFVVPDVKLATMAIIAMLNGVNTWFRDGGRLSQQAVADIYWSMVRKAFVADA